MMGKWGAAWQKKQARREKPATLRNKAAKSALTFGFLEPAALDALSRLAQSGGKIPETLTGKLAVRVALGLDTVAALHQQLGQVVADLRAQSCQTRSPKDRRKARKKEAKH